MAEVQKTTDGCDRSEKADVLPTPSAKAGDPKIIATMTRPTDACAGILPQTEIVADEKLLQQLYDKAIPDPQRQEIFSGRLKFIENYDPEVFKDMAQIAKDIDAGRPAAQIGTQIAEAAQGAVMRHADGNKPLDLTSPEFLKVLGGLSGMMLAARPTNNDMIDGAEKQLSRGNNKGIALANGALMQLHAVNWADNGEPSLAAYTDPSRDRYHFQLPGVELKQGAAVFTSAKPNP